MLAAHLLNRNARVEWTQGFLRVVQLALHSLGDPISAILCKNSSALLLDTMGVRRSICSETLSAAHRDPSSKPRPNRSSNCRSSVATISPLLANCRLIAFPVGYRGERRADPRAEARCPPR